MDTKALINNLQSDKHELQSILIDRRFKVNVMTKDIQKNLGLSYVQTYFFILQIISDILLNSLSLLHHINIIIHKKSTPIAFTIIYMLIKATF